MLTSLLAVLASVVPPLTPHVFVDDEAKEPVVTLPTALRGPEDRALDWIGSGAFRCSATFQRFLAGEEEVEAARTYLLQQVGARNDLEDIPPEALEGLFQHPSLAGSQRVVEPQECVERWWIEPEAFTISSDITLAGRDVREFHEELYWQRGEFVAIDAYVPEAAAGRAVTLMYEPRAQECLGGPLYVIDHSARRAALILERILEEGVAERDAYGSIHARVRPEQDFARRLYADILSAGLDPGAGVFYLPCTAEIRLAQDGETWHYEELWSDADGSALMRLTLVGASAVLDVQVENYLVGTEHGYFQFTASVERVSDGSDRPRYEEQPGDRINDRR